jgi:uncharacterized protein YraI
MRIRLILLITLLTTSHIFLFATDYCIATTGANVRTGAGKGYSVAFTLHKGDKVEILSKQDNWYEIKYLGKTGYASSKYLKSSLDPSNSTGFYFPILILIIAVLAIWRYNRWRFDIPQKQRRDYYRNEYLLSDEWQRKRYVVLKRDNWLCVYCGAPATQVHHKRYAKRNIGNEPIHWLVSICKSCHESIHH